MNTNTSTSTGTVAEMPDTVTLRGLLSHFQSNDPHIFNTIRDKEVTRCIKLCDNVGRTITASLFLELCMMDPEERSGATRALKNKELLDRFFHEYGRKEGVSYKDRSVLEKYESLKLGFAEVYGEESIPDQYLNQQRSELKQATQEVELDREEYLQQPVSDPKTRRLILAALKKVPFGAKELPYKIMYDLCHSHLAKGSFGEPITKGMLVYQPTSYIVGQYNHPTLQGLSV